jgi:hypothetical protein
MGWSSSSPRRLGLSLVLMATLASAQQVPTMVQAAARQAATAAAAAVVSQVQVRVQHKAAVMHISLGHERAPSECGPVGGAAGECRLRPTMCDQHQGGGLGWLDHEGLLSRGPTVVCV